MATSYWTSSNPKVKKRTDPWYQTYYWSVGFHLPECNALRTLDHKHIDHIITVRRAFEDRFRSVNFGGSWKRLQAVDIDDATVANLHDFCDVLLGKEVDRKIVINSPTITVYTNDVDFIQQIERLPYAKNCHVSKVELSGVPGAVMMKNPQHTYRSYFRAQRLNSDFDIANIIKYLENQTDIRLSPSLKNWMAFPTRRVQEYFFIDHDDMRVLQMLELVLPHVIGKTKQIKQDK